MLRSTEPIRLFARKHRRLRAIRPSKAPLAGLVCRSVRVRRDGEQTTLALDHRVSNVGRGRPYQRDTRHAGGLGESPHPFCSGPRLAGAAPSQNEPDAPITRRRKLLGSRDRAPVRFDLVGDAGENGLVARKMIHGFFSGVARCECVVGCDHLQRSGSAIIG